MSLLSYAVDAWCRPKPFLAFGHCLVPRRVYFRDTAGSWKSSDVSAVNGRNIKLPTACVTTTRSTAPKLSEVQMQELFRLAQRADSPAAILAIGTSNPPNCMPQDEYADWYFRVTKSEHLEELKAKMKRICDKSEIKKRYFHHSEELIIRHPEFLADTIPSIDTRLDITANAMPELAAVAARKAICEWGRPASEITHLVVSTYSGAHMPGADLQLASLLGINHSVQRTMLYYHGCAAASSALRVAKEIAENNRGARVLVACAELSLIFFQTPDESRHDTLVMQALFGDGGGAVIVGSDPETTIERPLFELVSAAQAVIPKTEHSVCLKLSKNGMDYHLSNELPMLVAENMEKCLADACRPLSLRGDWNDLFWVVHPGGRAILDSFEECLNLKQGKLSASRQVLSEYGNMSGAGTIFVLDEMRRRLHDNHGDEDFIKKCEWGAMVGLGPGVTVETMLMRAIDA
ncbi:unnamed protein product [Urochloa decumbens]|uniref:chalcone synthase n=1 Tax=Urochloa decumbens TaxID=240449 RepID=A0ABC9AKD2_9POAL